MHKYLYSWINILERRGDLLVALFIMITMILGGFYSVYLGDELRYLPDEQDYVAIASNLVSRGIYSIDGEHPTAYRSPGYPMILALFQRFGAEIIHFRMLNFCFLGAGLFILYKILQEQAKPLAATLSVLFAIAYPVLFYTAGTLYPQVLAGMLFLLVIYLFTKKEAGLGGIVLGALVMGYLVLTVPTFSFVAVGFAAWFGLVPKFRRRAGFLVYLIVVLLVVGLWTGRNYLAFHTFIFVSTNSGENLLLGNSENTLPNSGTNVDITAYTVQGEQLSEVERDRFYRAKALEYIQGHKLETLKLYLQKVINYFNIRNELVTQAEESVLKDLVMLLTYGPLLMMFFARLALTRRFRLTHFEVLISGLYIVSALVSAVFFTRIRFRLPFDFLVIIVAAILIDRFIHEWLKNQKNIHAEYSLQLEKVKNDS